MKKPKIALGIVSVSLLSAFILVSDASAAPTLQLYLEGAQYDTDTETWQVNIPGPSCKIWVIGDIQSYGTISDVRLAMAYDATQSLSIALTPATASVGQLPPPGDPLAPSAPAYLATGTGDAPLTGDGTPLQAHGIYGPGVRWVSYSLGDFTLTDSPIGDYMGSVPTTYPSTGQINAYTVTVNGIYENAWVHFDAYDHTVVGQNNVKYEFAPFSHDGESSHTPEPATLALFGLGIAGMVARRKRRI